MYSLAAYQYELPEELIAQYPAHPRDSSRLMIVDRKTGNITATFFRTLIEMLTAGDHLVFNDTRVVPARLMGKRKNGGVSEIFLIKQHADGSWNALVRPGKKLQVGSTIHFQPNFYCEIIAIIPNGERVLRFHCEKNLDQLLLKHGLIPLPHYIRRDAVKEDLHSYQTVYAKHAGALAAPTAGLHFTEEILTELHRKGISTSSLTLHTGLGTFTPVKTVDIREHTMHAERAIILPEAAKELNQFSKGSGLNIVVGTTCCRALETAAKEGIIVPGEYDTDIFIYPGYQFKYVKSLLTNFHLPGSTLLMLVSALAGYDLIKEAYKKAVMERFRFFSYGDAMLIL
jgi:S-adenosylmethionine:tRNA ribosyltransferase-isomerase